MALVIGVAVALVGLIVLARPHEVLAYVRDHQTFVVGASFIGALGMMLASGLSLMLRRQ